MNDPFLALTQVLSEIVVPNLCAVQRSQAEQIAANNRLEAAIEELRAHLEAQFTRLSAQLTSTQAELAATQAALIAVQTQSARSIPGRPNRVH